MAKYGDLADAGIFLAKVSLPVALYWAIMLSPFGPTLYVFLMFGGVAVLLLPFAGMIDRWADIFPSVCAFGVALVVGGLCGAALLRGAFGFLSSRIVKYAGTGLALALSLQITADAGCKTMKAMSGGACQMVLLPKP